MLKFSHFAVSKLYFKPSFSDISQNCGPLLLQINSDRYLGGFCPEILSRGFCPELYVRVFLSGGLCSGTGGAREDKRL